MDTFAGSILRRKLISLVITVFIAVAVMSLFYMQIIQRRQFNEQSNENSVKPVPQVAPRGIFYDRFFRVMVGNRPSFSVQIIPADYKDRKLDPLIEGVLDLPSGYISQILKDTTQYSKFIPRKVKRDVDFKAIAWFEENQNRLPGVHYVMETLRDYSFGVNGVHMFGYIKEISQEYLAKHKDEYTIGDNIGNNGLEKAYEQIVRGDKGMKYMLVDARQKTIGRYKDGKEDKITKKGNDLVLSIDRDVQKVAEEAFQGKRGAAVAIEPETGEIIAFVSAPQYDLTEFATVVSQEAWSRLNNDESKPLFNRATMSMFSPGSTFKMVAAIAALEEGLITTETKYNCSGSFSYGNRSFGCEHVHGTINVETAITKSCNVFFYNLILKLGLDKWSEYAAKLGFGKKTAVDIGEEVRGILPSEAYYNKVYGKSGWTKGFLVSLGIGQGELSVTPIQLAKYTALIANYGQSADPHFLKGYIDKQTGNFVPAQIHKIQTNISRATLDIVRRAMYNVVQGAGTAASIKLPNIEIAGKTGTAQNPHGKPHSLFLAFAPYDNPKIAVAVMVENAGYGSTTAAPIARDLIKAYLDKNSLNKEATDKAIKTGTETARVTH
jgi:penicillin-binding protein 2